MCGFFRGVPMWYNVTGLSAARLPGVVAAAAGLATVATSVGFMDRLHPSVSPIVFYAANPALLSASSSSAAFSSSESVPLFPSGSSHLNSAGGNLSADLLSYSSLPLVQGNSNFSPTMTSLSSTYRVASHLFPAKGYHCLSYPSLFSASPLRPLFSYSTLKLPRNGPHRYFNELHTVKPVLGSSFAEFTHSSPAKAPSSPLNSANLDAYDVSTHLASFFSLAAAPSSHPHPFVISSKSLHRWHAPIPGILKREERDGTLPGTKPALTVVLLGWLGSQQKHLKKYAEWYNSQGIHAVTFTLPMADILSISMGGKVEEHVELLTNQLSTWMESEGDKGAERQLIFHTFSNTGWLTYGVVLEKLSSRGSDWADRIKGCVVDSAPAADPDPHIWASGFSAALWKKRSNPSNGGLRDSGIADSRHKIVVETSKPHVAEFALHSLLKKFFFYFLQIPAIHQRLSQVVTVLSKDQPTCPQLYIYSTADKVIPAKLVESFMEKQRQQGRIVRGCNFLSSPHVDHFRSFPEIYSKQVSNFLQECLSTTSKQT